MKRMKKFPIIFIMAFIFMLVFFNSASNAAAPRITSPYPDSTLSGSTDTFIWAAFGAAVQAYWLYVGTSAGSNNIYDSGYIATSTTSAMVGGLPTNGSTIYVRLYYRMGGSWATYMDYQYTAFGE